MSGTALAPGLLLASPSLHDPNFERSVILLGRHDEEGALGWILNGKELASVTEILRSSGIFPVTSVLPIGGAFARTARRGGPVATSSGWVIYQREAGELPGEMDCGEVAVTGEVTAFSALARGEGPSDFRVILGCAGWAPGQLEAEIGAGAWLPAPLETELLFDRPAESLWTDAYRLVVGVGPAAFTSHRRGVA